MSTLEEITIAMSHEDFDTWSTLTVGFNYTKSLVICLTFYDYKNVQHHTYATIEKDEAMAMSEQLNVKLNRLTPNHMQTLRRHVVCICAVSCRRTFQRCTEFITRRGCTIIAYQEIKITPKYSLHFSKIQAQHSVCQNKNTRTYRPDK